MIRFSWHLAIAVVVLSATKHPAAFGQTIGSKTQTENSQNGDFDNVELAIDNSGQAILYYKEFFDTASLIEIKQKQFSARASFAVQCAWRAINSEWNDVQPAQAAKYKALVWFIGFVEGKAAIDIPPWWEDVILANQHNEDTAVRPWGENYREPPKTSFTGMPADILEQVKAEMRPGDSIAWTNAQGRLVATRYNDFGCGGPIWCFDVVTATLMWKRRCPSCGSQGGSAAGSDHRVELNVTESEVLLSSAGSGGYCLQLLSIETGSTRFFFCSNY